MLDIILSFAGMSILSHILARIFGVVFLVLFSGVLLNQKFFQHLCLGLHKQYMSVILIAVLILISVTSAIIVHNNLSFDLAGGITSLLWAVFFVSAFCILYPARLIHFIQHIAENKRLFVAIAATFCVLGICLILFSFDPTIDQLFQPEFQPQL